MASRPMAPMAMRRTATRRNAASSLAWTDARSPATHRTSGPKGQWLRSRRGLLSVRPGVASGAGTEGSAGFSLSYAHIPPRPQARRAMLAGRPLPVNARASLSFLDSLAAGTHNRPAFPAAPLASLTVEEEEAPRPPTAARLHRALPRGAGSSRPRRWREEP